MSTAHDRPFSPEPTPLLAEQSDVTGGIAATEWVGEKTILIAEDAVPAIFLQVVATGEWLPLAEFPVVIGRHDLATVTLNDPSVSRRHAQIISQGAHGFAIEDLGSSNGIKVEGKRVERLLLMDGDRFELGRIGLRFSTRGPDDAAIADAVADSVTTAAPIKSVDQFDPRKFLPIAAATIALVALLMFINRTPRTVVLPTAPDAQGVVPASQTTDVEAPAVAQASIVDSQVETNNDVQAEAATVGPQNLTLPREVRSMEMATELGVDGVSPQPVVSVAADVPPPTQKIVEAELPPPEPVKVAPAPPPAAKKPARSVRRTAKFSRAYIDTALQMYLDGDSENALRRLGIMSRSLRNQKQFRDEARVKAQQVAALVADYEQGQSALDRGDRQEAAVAWARFLRDEGTLFGGDKSVYANRISRVVADQYTRDGDAANAEGRFHDAYLAWSKAMQYEPEGASSVSLARLQARGQELYREGYRLESVNIERAKALWYEVVEVLPPGTEYHTKARAKLRWHEQAARG